MIALPAAFALPNSCLTFDAPIHTSISINSDHDAVKNATSDSHATALANSVFPDQGCPYSSTPLGGLAPTLWYFCGFLRKSTISVSSCFTSSIHAMSENLVVASFLFVCFPTLKLKGIPQPFGPINLNSNINNQTKNIKGRT